MRNNPVVIVALTAFLAAFVASEARSGQAPRLPRGVSEVERQRQLIEQIRKQQEAERLKREADRRRESIRMSTEMLNEAMAKGREALKQERYSEAYMFFEDVAKSRVPGMGALAAEAERLCSEIDLKAGHRNQEAAFLEMQRRRVDAAIIYSEVSRVFDRTPSAEKAKIKLRVLLGDPSIASEVRFLEGKAWEDAGDYLNAYLIYLMIEGDAKWSRELATLEARNARRRLERDPEMFAIIQEHMLREIETETRNRLRSARTLLLNGLYEEAIPNLKWIVENFPDGTEAIEAVMLLKAAEEELAKLTTG